jgi:hypothetical protein
VYFDPSPAHALDQECVPTGSLVLSTIDDVREAALTQTGRLRRVSTFYDPNGAAFFNDSNMWQLSIALAIAMAMGQSAVRNI